MVLFDFGIPSLPWTNGGDVAGTVLKVGSKVTKFKVGERVIAFVSRKTARHGGYQTHTIVEEAGRAAKLPESYTFEAGSTIPLAYVTAAAGLIATLGVKLSSSAPPNGEPLLVWGGSSSVGAFAIQLAKSSGYTVLTTASKTNHDYVRKLGADHVFDYHDADVVQSIRAAAGDKLSLVYDAISENGSVEGSVASITSPQGGIVATVLAVNREEGNIKVVGTGARLAYEQPAVGERTYAVLQELLDSGALVPNPVKVIEGGLRGVQTGWELGRDHKVSGEKLVYRIADTKF